MWLIITEIIKVNKLLQYYYKLSSYVGIPPEPGVSMLMIRIVSAVRKAAQKSFEKYR